MEFYKLAGRMALGSRLRRLGDILMNDAQQLYQHYGVNIDPRWFPVFYMLINKGSAGITELAEDIGQTHPAVSQVVGSMMKKGIVYTKKCPKDARVNRVSLTEKGKDIASKITPQCIDVGAAIDNFSSDIGAKIWGSLEAIEQEISDKSLYERVMDQRKGREAQKMKLVPYQSQYQYIFKHLNVSWIEKYWKMEESDYKALDNPVENIINRGGYIALALHNSEPVGTCALLKIDDGSFELAKMAVSESARGMGVGFQLGVHVINKARELGARRIYLESNTVLTPALNLYRKLGFINTSGNTSPYARCDVQMELILDDGSTLPLA